MFKSIFEKVVIGVMSAVILALIYWIWDLARVVRSDIFIPSGAIVAFNKECPEDGWEEFEPASGKFVLGRSKDMGLGETGGNATIPSHGEHNHAVQFGRNEHGGRFGNDGIDDDWSTVKDGTHNHGGENRPPFIALNYCRKS